MLPLSPPNGYWRKLHSAISKFLWNNKRPRLKMSTIQRRRLDGGLAVPNFKLYFWSFSLRPLINWFNPKAVVSWHALEEELVSPWRLQDVIFTNISIKQCQLSFEPLIAYVIQIWRNSQKSCAILCPWHLDSPIFNNNQLLIGRRPIIFSQWEKKGSVMTYQAHLSFFIYNLGWPLGPMGSCGISHWNNTSSTNSLRTEELPGALLQGPSLRQTVENDVPELRLDFDWDSVRANVIQITNKSTRILLIEFTLLDGSSGWFPMHPVLLGGSWYIPPHVLGMSACRLFLEQDLLSAVRHILFDYACISNYFYPEWFISAANSWVAEKTYPCWPHCGQEIGSYEVETPQQALSEQLDSHISWNNLLGVLHYSCDWSQRVQDWSVGVGGWIIKGADLAI